MLGKKPSVLLLFSLGLHIVLLASTQFTAWPEMLVYPYLMERGFSFYGDIIHPYLPLLPFGLLALFRLFALTPVVLHTATIFLVVIGDLLIYRIARRYFSVIRSGILLSFFVMLQVLFEGNGLWFDTAVIPFALLSFYALTHDVVDKHRTLPVFTVGLLLGVAFGIKQTALWYLFAAVGTVLFMQHTGRARAASIVLLFGGFVIPFGTMLLLFGADLYVWGIVFPFTIMPASPGFILYPTLRQVLVSVMVFAPIVLLGLVKSKARLIIFIWFLASLGFAVPRFSYFHLQPALPFFVLLLGLVWQTVVRLRFARVGLAVYTVIIGLVFVRFFHQQLGRPAYRFFEPHVLAIASEIRDTVPESETVFFYNTPGNYIVASRRTPAKPWVDTFPWYLELPGMQERVIAGLDAVHWVVARDFGGGGRFELGSYKPQLIDEVITQEFELFYPVADDTKILTKPAAHDTIKR